MAEKEINGKVISLDDEGYMTDNSQWDEGIALELAKEMDMPELTEDHWKVIKFIQNEYATSGTIPTLRKIGKQSGVDMKGLYKLFPDGPVKKASRISGLTKPKSCI